MGEAMQAALIDKLSRIESQPERDAAYLGLVRDSTVETFVALTDPKIPEFLLKVTPSTRERAQRDAEIKFAGQQAVEMRDLVRKVTEAVRRAKSTLDATAADLRERVKPTDQQKSDLEALARLK
jgi:hypothetical protein